MNRHEHTPRTRGLLWLLCVGLTSLTGLAASGVHAQPAEPPLTVAGTLVDERGIPTPGVEVTLRPYPSAYEIGLDLLGQPAALPQAVDRTRSEPDGGFSVSAPLPGPYVLEIRPPVPADRSGAVLPRVYGNLAPLKVSRTLEPNELPDRHDIAVQVLDADSQPVEGAHVIAVATAARSYRWTRVPAHEQQERLYPWFHRAAARTDTTGTVRFLMPTREASIVVSAPGFLVATATTQSRRTALRLDPAAGIRFRVRGPDGEPAPRILIRATGQAHVPLAVTDDSGSAFVPRLADTSGQYEFERADHAFASSTPQARVTAESETDSSVIDVLDLQLRTQDQLKVIVSTQSGEPVSGAWIRVVEEGAIRSTGYGTTDASGQVQIGVAPGDVEVTVEHDLYQDESTRMVLRPGNNELVVQLGAGGAIRGTVRSGDGTPLGLANVEAHAEDSLNVPATSRRFVSQPVKTVSDEGGRFQLTGLEPGKYLLVASAPGFATDGPNQSIEIEGQSVDGVDIVLDAGASIVGVVTGLDASDLSSVEISATRNARWELTAPDPEGNFAFEGMAAGEWQIVARQGSGFESRPVERSMTISGGDADAFVELAFERGLRLSGQLLADGQPVGGAFLGTMPAGTEGLRWTQTDHRGQFEVEGLEPGPYEFTIQQATASTEHRSIDLQTDIEGLRIDLQPPATVIGVVVDAITGRPLAGASLMAGEASQIAAGPVRSSQSRHHRKRPVPPCRPDPRPLPGHSPGARLRPNAVARADRAR